MQAGRHHSHRINLLVPISLFDRRGITPIIETTALMVTLGRNVRPTLSPDQPLFPVDDPEFLQQTNFWRRARNSWEAASQHLGLF